jgi:hypothetical protein
MITTLGEMIDKAQVYVDTMTRFFADFRDQAQNGEARLLTYHLARQKRSLAQLQTVFSPEELAQARTFKLEGGGTEFDPERIFDAAYLVPGAKPSEVIATALEFMAVIACLYQWLAGQFTALPAAKVIAELIENEEKEIAGLKAIKAKHF